MENPIPNSPLPPIGNKIETVPNFKQIFDEKLGKIEPATGQDAKDWASWYKDPEIPEVAKEVPAIFFDPNNLKDLAPPTDIFIEDPQNLDRTSHYIHEQVIDKLGKLLSKSTMPYLLSGYVLEGADGKRYLVLDDTRTIMVQSKLRRAEEMGSQEEFSILDVLNRYGIKKVIERVSTKVETEDSTTWEGGSREVIGKSLLDKRREDMALINLARIHGMTNSQYLRLKILADSLFKAGTQVSLDEVAQSIVKDEDGVNISVKNSLG